MKQGFQRQAAAFIGKNLPDILGGAGIACFGAAIGLAIVNAPKAQEALEAARKEKQRHQLSFKEKCQAMWKYYLPVGLAASAGTAFSICGMHENHKRTAALGAACALSQSALRTYQETVKESLGEKKEKVLKDAIAAKKEETKDTPLRMAEAAVIPNGSGVLCYDAVSGRYFRSTKQDIMDAKNRLNERMLGGPEMFASLNEFYDEIGARELEHIGIGNDLGWNVNAGLVEVYLSSKLLDNGIPCLVMDYEVLPEYRYSI